ncbi:hypothetical protein NP493_355g02033 [Ridgeia piscesae]|uniref:Uncharacterized protein n=1 Tax=Ridgeia piscesae TaxID=27915 RepID=A0AAD9L3H0_RIDPI|nr:hypothetical protein NP493_355g02033 [Ridgeia piscesae]
MMVTDIPIYVNNTQIENVESYIYLGQRYSTRDKIQDNEIERRITAGWTAFAKHRDIFKGNCGTCLKRHIYNSCVLPAMTYGAETWALTTHAKNMLKITHRDRKTNIWRAIALRQLLLEKNDWQWEAEQAKEWQDIKDFFKTEPLLTFYDPARRS